MNSTDRRMPKERQMLTDNTFEGGGGVGENTKSKTINIYGNGNVRIYEVRSIRSIWNSQNSDKLKICGFIRRQERLA